MARHFRLFGPAYLILAILLFAPSLFAVDAITTPGKADSSYYKDLAKVHQRYGFNEEALEMYRKALELEAEPEEQNVIRLSMAKTWIALGKGEEARDAVLQALETEEDENRKIQQHFTLARAHEKLGEPEEAIASYEYILKNCSKTVDSEAAHDRMNKLIMANGFLEGYVETLKARIEKDPDDLIAVECLARAYCHEESTIRQAIPLFEKLLESNRNDENTVNELIRLYKRIGEYEKAIEVYVAIINSTPDEPHKPYFQRISNLYLEAEKPEDALQWDLKALQESPDNPFGILRVAQRYKQLSQNDKAESYYAQAVEKAGKVSDKELMTLEFVDFCIDTSNLEKAQQLADSLLESSSDPVIRKEAEARQALIRERLNHAEKTEG